MTSLSPLCLPLLVRWHEMRESLEKRLAGGWGSDVLAMMNRWAVSCRVQCLRWCENLGSDCSMARRE